MKNAGVSLPSLWTIELRVEAGAHVETATTEDACAYTRAQPLSDYIGAAPAPRRRLCDKLAHRAPRPPLR